ncbi:hypothetical protein RUM43_003157 [Polyplax serrata]|uniref:BACK domain-containing protein n=1 Tax=Polyplax serrata TaxID=468196 RepID=A0AAN8NW35_POLSC
MLELLEAVNMLRFTDIEEVCSQIILESVDVTNCLKVLDIACRVESEELVRKARAHALWRFEEIARLETFQKLHVDQVEGYCSDEALYSPTGELGVWMALDRWMNFSTDQTSTSRRQYLSRLLLCLRLKSLSITDLERMLLYDSIRSCKMIVNVIENVINERYSLTSQAGCSETKRLKMTNEEIEDFEKINMFMQGWLNVKPRKLPWVPYIVGNIFADTDVSNPYILKFCEIEKKFIPVTRLSQMETNAGTMVGYKVISDGVKIYLVGGMIINRENYWNDIIWIFDPLKNTWSYFANITRPMRHMSVCILENELYVMGGFGRHRVIQNQVSKLNLKDQVWSECSSMPQSVYSTPCVAFQNAIYVIDSNVYEYVPKVDMWRTMPIKQFFRGFSCAMADDEYIYLVGNSTNVIYKFDPKEPKEDFEIVGQFKNECTQACLIDGYVYSLSHDDILDEITCEKMNIKTGKTSVLYEGRTDTVIADLSSRHRHGCFPFLTY